MINNKEREYFMKKYHRLRTGAKDLHANYTQERVSGHNRRRVKRKDHITEALESGLT